MAKKESNFLNMVLTLFIVSAVASTALGYIYELTKDPIRLAKEKKVQDAVKNVLPEFDKLGEVYELTPDDAADPLTFYPAFDANGELIGTAIKTYTMKGFSGFMSFMVGILPDGTISNYSVLEHKETPGLGTKMDFWFNDETQQGRCILKKNIRTSNLTVSKDGGEIDAITAATISSRGFLDAIERAAKTLEEEKGGKK